MRGTYNLSLFNNDFKHILEKEFVSLDWEKKFINNVDFSDYSKYTNFRYGFPNTHNLENIRNIFSKVQNNTIKYLFFNKMNLDVVEEFLNNNKGEKFYLKCVDPQYNENSYICKSFDQIKSILKLRYSKVPKNINYILDVVKPSLLYNNNKFTIDVVFLANKINNEYHTYVYPKLLIKIKTDKKEKKVNLTNENVNFKKNQFHSRDGEIFSVESVKNEIIIFLQNILGIFENYLKVSNDIFDLERKLNHYNTNESTTLDSQSCLYTLKFILTDDSKIVPVDITNLYIANGEKENKIDNLKIQCINNFVDNLDNLSNKNTKFNYVHLKDLTSNVYNFNIVYRNERVVCKNKSYLKNNSEIDLSSVASDLVEKIMVENKINNKFVVNNSNNSNKLMLQNNIKSEKEKSKETETETKKEIKKEDNKIVNETKQLRKKNNSKNILKAALVAGTSLFVYGNKEKIKDRLN